MPLRRGLGGSKKTKTQLRYMYKDGPFFCWFCAAWNSISLNSLWLLFVDNTFIISAHYLKFRPEFCLDYLSLKFEFNGTWDYVK